MRITRQANLSERGCFTRRCSAWQVQATPKLPVEEILEDLKSDRIAQSTFSHQWAKGSIGFFGELWKSQKFPQFFRCSGSCSWYPYVCYFFFSILGYIAQMYPNIDPNPCPCYHPWISSRRPKLTVSLVSLTRQGNTISSMVFGCAFLALYCFNLFHIQLLHDYTYMHLQNMNQYWM